MRTRLRLPCIVLLLAACSESKPPAAETPSTAPAVARDDAMPSQPPAEEASVAATQTLQFGDGSGNHYLITSSPEGTTLVYSPVTPENSSSGTYSGGEPANVTLDAENSAALWSKVQELQTNKAIHAAARGMGTGAFTIAGSENSDRFIVKMGPELSAFVGFLEDLKKQ